MLTLRALISDAFYIVKSIIIDNFKLAIEAKEHIPVIC